MENLIDSSSINNKKKIIDMPLNDQNDALQILIQFIFSAYSKGAFTLEESHKIWLCIKKFMKNEPTDNGT